MNKLILRAIIAFTRKDIKTNNADFLDIKGRELVYLGKQYVLIESQETQALLAVYRCMNRGELKRLKRWAAEMVQTPATSATKDELKRERTPAILELAPFKSRVNPQKVKSRGRKLDQKNVKQTDMFE
jgi:hypothetical protein